MEEEEKEERMITRKRTQRTMNWLRLRMRTKKRATLRMIRIKEGRE